MLFVAGSAAAAPPGFIEIRSTPGATLFNSGPDYVQVIRLKEGCQASLHHGGIHPVGETGFQPVYRQSLEDVWSNLSSNYDVFSVTNGQFFDTGSSPAGLAFSTKINGSMIAYGYDNNNAYLGEKMMFEIRGTFVDITPFDDDWHTVDNLSAPHVLVGLREDADKNPYSAVGRTFIGCGDDDQDGRCEVVYIFNSSASTQPHAAQTLRDFGATKVVMFDGGGSAQMICQGTGYVNSSRSIPQTIAVVTSEYHHQYVSQNPDGWHTYYPGEIIDFECVYSNDGTVTWNNIENVTDPGSIELWACGTNGELTENGNPISSWLDPIGWINGQRVGSCEEEYVWKDGQATFSFTASIPETMPPGQKWSYFRPTHGGQAMDDWPGMAYLIDVIPYPATNLSFEVDDFPSDGIPDGWDLHTWNGAAFTYVSGDAADGMRSVKFTHTNINQSSAIGLPAATYMQAGTFYRMHFWYKTNLSQNDVFGWRLATTDFQNSIEVLSAKMQNPIADGNWHRYWSPPFQVTQNQLNNYPFAAFFFLSGYTGRVTIDWVSFVQINPCP